MRLLDEASMAEENSDNSGFKVVDRRSFTNQGELRPEVSAEDTEREISRPSARAPAGRAEPNGRAEPSPTSLEAEPDLEGEPTGFETLVSYLSTTAMFQLGLIPGPSGERIPIDLPNARRTIELLEVLQEKTQGNLTPQESRLLEDVLYELRLGYVEQDKRLARKGK
jgi:uncharacterized protein DUF1844